MMMMKMFGTQLVTVNKIVTRKTEKRSDRKLNQKSGAMGNPTRRRRIGGSGYLSSTTIIAVKQ
jgi:hypothetical protein